MSEPLAERRTDNPQAQNAPHRAPVGRIEPDSGLDRMTRLAGLYLGNSPQRAFWRLYLTETFDRYLEFRRQDTVDAKRQPDGRIIVWLVPHAEIGAVDTASEPAEFLRGDFQDHLTHVSRWTGIRRVLLLEAGSCGGGGGTGGKKDGGPDGGTVAPGQVMQPGTSCATPN